ncbi:GNAT family N-acetyltransferase [Streptomyces erythrochromogenes]|uniref:GNAT family N-acetyltransferase n=1 Tax=Streptomyces erythrochromogenes TaxID=285574 RepID=UPI003815C351
MTAINDATCEYRIARPEDTEDTEALDGSFRTTALEVAVTGDGFALREVPADPPLVEVFPEDEGGDDAETEGGGADARTFVAVGAARARVGFAAVSCSPWNRRLTIEDNEVAADHRGRGIGRALTGHALDFARERGAGHVWLDVTNVNAPAVHAYRRMGFSLCGLDAAL